jgi:signal transduction histidine kinase
MSDMQLMNNMPIQRLPPWLLDLLLGVVVTLVIALVMSAAQGGRQAADAIAYCFAIGFGALMLLRCRWPVAVLILSMLLLFVYYTLGYPAIGLAVPVVAALYSAAERGHIRAAIVVSLLLIGVSTYFRLEGGESAGYLGYELSSTATLLAAAIALGDSTRARRELHMQQEQTNRLMAQEHAYRAEQHVQAERMHIARDLHDLIGHSISVISLHTDVAREALERDDPGVHQALGHIRSTCSETMRELRNTVKLLQNPGTQTLDRSFSSLANLATLIEHTTASGLQTHVDLQGDLTTVPAAVDAAAYRIIQESLTNVLRHAGATHVTVRIIAVAPRLQLVISDNGTTGRGILHDGNGIAGMRERVRLLGGTLVAQPGQLGGFAVVATLPYQEG